MRAIGNARTLIKNYASTYYFLLTTIMSQKSILITGGAGFIGSHVVRRFVRNYPQYRIINLDSLTYAGNLDNVADVADEPNYLFVQADISDRNTIIALFDTYNIHSVIHLAAESHVDRSIENPILFVQTNVIGTINLLDAARHYWQKHPTQPDEQRHLFYQVSTDEVYGTLGEEGLFTETTPYDPRSPYSASKASADHFVMAYFHTYDLPALISNCSNNYGANQYPEKLIPLCISNIVEGRELPIYGDGKYTRDWLYVLDHARAIDIIFHQGVLGETYNVGGHNEWTNLDLVHLLCDLTDAELAQPVGTARQLIRFVKDRAGHDRRYAIDASKMQQHFGFLPSVDFPEGLRQTVQWYVQKLKNN